MRLNLLKILAIGIALLIPLSMAIADLYEVNRISQFYWIVYEIGHIKPIFRDLRTIPNLEQFMNGNWGERFNYPDIWVYIVQFASFFGNPYVIIGITQWIALLFVFAFVIYFAHNSVEVILITMLTLSPPIFLLLERGNNDATVFLLALLAVFIRSQMLSGALMTLAGALKLFPIFGLIAGLQRRSLAFYGGAALAAPLFLWALADIERILNKTPVPGTIAFGARSVAKLVCHYAQKYFDMSIGCSNEFWIIVSIIFCLSAAALLFAYKAAYRQALKHIAKDDTSLKILAVFGLIFCMLTALAASFAYRIIFVLPILVLITKTGIFSSPRKTPILVSRVFIVGALMMWSPIMTGWGPRLFGLMSFAFAILVAPLVALSIWSLIQSWYQRNQRIIAISLRYLGKKPTSA